MIELRPITITLNTALDLVYEVSHLQLGAHQVGRQVRRLAAGKGVNVARALARLNVPALATGFVGRDAADYFRDQLRAADIASRFVPVAGRTRENVTLLDPVSQTETHVRDQGFTVTADDLSHLQQLLVNHCHTDTPLLFCGSLPPGMDAAALRRLVATCIAGGARVAVDSGGATLRALRDAGLWLIKPNRDELAELVGADIRDDDDLLQQARTLTPHYAEVLISCGGAGALIAVGDTVHRARLTQPLEHVQSTVGCGDTLTAGYVAARLAGSPPPEALRHAVAAASAAAESSTPGEFDGVRAAELRHAVRLEPCT